MKRALVLFLILAVVLLLGVTVAAADSENSALVIKLDQGCVWFYDGLLAKGSAVFVGTQNGNWKLTCTGKLFRGLTSPDRAVQTRSTSDDSLGVCITPFGTTANWHVTFSPSGKSSMMCRGF